MTSTTSQSSADQSSVLEPKNSNPTKLDLQAAPSKQRQWYTTKPVDPGHPAGGGARCPVPPLALPISAQNPEPVPFQSTYEELIIGLVYYAYRSTLV
jgi:hypothetical protein